DPRNAGVLGARRGLGRRERQADPSPPSPNGAPMPSRSDAPSRRCSSVTQLATMPTSGAHACRCSAST
ncbi:MAG TPA: hypothetical protein VGM39_26240, partial [Kofleriaceae bacterium]